MTATGFTPDDDDYDVIIEYAEDIYDYPLSNYTQHLSEKSLDDGMRRAEAMFVAKSKMSLILIMKKLQRIKK